MEDNVDCWKGCFGQDQRRLAILMSNMFRETVRHEQNQRKCSHRIRMTRLRVAICGNHVVGAWVLRGKEEILTCFAEVPS